LCHFSKLWVIVFPAIYFPYITRKNVFSSVKRANATFESRFCLFAAQLIKFNATLLIMGRLKTSVDDIKTTLYAAASSSASKNQYSQFASFESKLDFNIRLILELDAQIFAH
jgi:hypothetical protein